MIGCIAIKNAKGSIKKSFTSIWMQRKKNRGKFVESIVSNMSEMSYGAGSMGAVRPQADMKNIQSKKSPLQKLKDFDKVRAGLGKKPIFKDNEKKKESLSKSNEKD